MQYLIFEFSLSSLIRKHNWLRRVYTYNAYRIQNIPESVQFNGLQIMVSTFSISSTSLTKNGKDIKIHFVHSTYRMHTIQNVIHLQLSSGFYVLLSSGILLYILVTLSLTAIVNWEQQHIFFSLEFSFNRNGEIVTVHWR